MADDNKILNQGELENVAGGLVEFEICKIHNTTYNKYWGCPKCNPDKCNPDMGSKKEFIEVNPIDFG